MIGEVVWPVRPGPHHKPGVTSTDLLRQVAHFEGHVSKYGVKGCTPSGCTGGEGSSMELARGASLGCAGHALRGF